jgi:hypothetical protein
MRLTPLLTSTAILLSPALAQADWIWKTPANPSAANTEGAKLSGATPCKVTQGNKTFLGSIKNGACEHKTDGGAVQQASFPSYQFLAITAPGTTFTPVTRIVNVLPGVPRGVVRGSQGEQGPVLCSAKNSLGWLDVPTRTCITPAGANGMLGSFSLFLHGPADSFVDLPPLWRDTQTTGTTSGHQHFCRASITPNAPKMSPGIFSPENGGSCSFLSGVSTSGEVIFARTTDKSRYLVLFASSNSSEHLEMWGFNTDARLRIGIVGSEQTYGCFRESHVLSNPPRPMPAARGIFFQNRCVAPSDSGMGAGIIVHNSVGEKFPSVKLLSVFSRFLGVGGRGLGLRPVCLVETVGLGSPRPGKGGRGCAPSAWWKRWAFAAHARGKGG